MYAVWSIMALCGIVPGYQSHGIVRPDCISLYLSYNLSGISTDAGASRNVVDNKRARLYKCSRSYAYSFQYGGVWPYPNVVFYDHRTPQNFWPRASIPKR